MTEPKYVSEELLTQDEHAVIGDAGSLYTISEIFGDGKHKDIDLVEIRLHIHAIQYAIMANAAARAYPDRYTDSEAKRLLRKSVGATNYVDLTRAYSTVLSVETSRRGIKLLQISI